MEVRSFFFTLFLCSFCVQELFRVIRKEKFVCYFISYRLSCTATPTLFFPSVRNPSRLLPLTSQSSPWGSSGRMSFPSHQINETVRLAKIDTEGKEKRKVWRAKVEEIHRNWSGVLRTKKDYSFSPKSTSDDHMNITWTPFLELIEAIAFYCQYCKINVSNNGNFDKKNSFCIRFCILVFSCSHYSLQL